MAERPAPHRRVLLGSVRLRTTMAAVLVVGVAIAIGAIAMVATLRSRLVDGVEAAAERRAEAVVADLEAGRAPDLSVSDDDEELVQVVAADGTVVLASANVGRTRPVADPDDADGRQLDVEVDDDEERFLLVVESADSGGREVQVIVGRSVGDVSESTETVGGLLSVGAPLLLLLVGVTTWWVVGRALRPVDRIRREVDEITIAEMHRRVPEPGSRDEIGRLATTMNRMLGRLQQGQERQQRFVADASHELRSPVASLHQHAEVARAHPDRVELADFAGVVLSESDRMGQLVSDLLLLARSDEGSLQLAHRAVDLDDLVFEEARRAREGSDLRIDTSGVGAGRVRGDEAALRRTVRNLVDNATRHASTVVLLRLASGASTVELVVADDGPGIPIADRARVVERFVRLDASRARDSGGSGLGLAIVHEVVLAHGGDLRIDDAPGGGALVVVRLPEAADT